MSATTYVGRGHQLTVRTDECWIQGTISLIPFGISLAQVYERAVKDHAPKLVHTYAAHTWVHFSKVQVNQVLTDIRREIDEKLPDAFMASADNPREMELLCKINNQGTIEKTFNAIAAKYGMGGIAALGWLLKNAIINRIVIANTEPFLKVEFLDWLSTNAVGKEFVGIVLAFTFLAFKGSSNLVRKRLANLCTPREQRVLVRLCLASPAWKEVLDCLLIEHIGWFPDSLVREVLARTNQKEEILGRIIPTILVVGCSGVIVEQLQTVKNLEVFAKKILARLMCKEQLALYLKCFCELRRVSHDVMLRPLLVYPRKDLQWIKNELREYPAFLQSISREFDQMGSHWFFESTLMRGKERATDYCYQLAFVKAAANGAERFLEWLYDHRRIHFNWAVYLRAIAFAERNGHAATVEWLKAKIPAKHSTCSEDIAFILLTCFEPSGYAPFTGNAPPTVARASLAIRGNPQFMTQVHQGIQKLMEAPSGRWVIQEVGQMGLTIEQAADSHFHKPKRITLDPNYATKHITIENGQEVGYVPPFDTILFHELLHAIHYHKNRHLYDKLKACPVDDYTNLEEKRTITGIDIECEDHIPDLLSENTYNFEQGYPRRVYHRAFVE
jgi:hypothetical protein